MDVTWSWCSLGLVDMNIGMNMCASMKARIQVMSWMLTWTGGIKRGHPPALMGHGATPCTRTRWSVLTRVRRSMVGWGWAAATAMSFLPEVREDCNRPGYYGRHCKRSLIIRRPPAAVSLLLSTSPPAGLARYGEGLRIVSTTLYWLRYHSPKTGKNRWA